MIAAIRLAPLAVLVIGSAAQADHPFILPSSTSLSGGSAMATFDAAGSDHVFFLDHRAIQLGSIKVTKPDGTAGETANSAQLRLRSVFDVRLDQPGTWTVASSQSMVFGSFKLNGEERRVGGRGGGPGGPGAPGPASGAPRPEGGNGPGGDGPRGAAAGGPGGGGPGGGGPAGGAPGGAEGPRRLPPVPIDQIPAEATEIHLTETVNRVETFVTLGAPSPVQKPAGKGLEFDPITHPNELVAGETAKFRFLIDGKPAAGVKVTYLQGGDRYRDDVGEKEVTTGADGTVSIKWAAAGMYWLGAEAEDKSPSEKRAEARRMNYSATLEVMTP